MFKPKSLSVRNANFVKNTQSFVTLVTISPITSKESIARIPKIISLDPAASIAALVSNSLIIDYGASVSCLLLEIAGYEGQICQLDEKRHSLSLNR